MNDEEEDIPPKNCTLTAELLGELTAMAVFAEKTDRLSIDQIEDFAL
jgi:hypothetical protein